MATINPLSIASFLTELFFNDMSLGTATSFAYKYKNNKYLITNYHVAYGRNPENGQSLNKMGSIPNKMSVYFYTQKMEPMFYTILYPETENPFKYITINDTIIDIAIYKLDEKFIGVCINEIEELSKFLKQENNILLGITESLYVLGYPRGINIALTPIWKRSSIASEPDINPNGIPYFYIDTTTREGMSGSPVIFYTSNGSYQTATGCSVLAGGCAYNLVGIYSGRDINDESHIAQLGKVWKKELIEQIIDKYF